MQPLAGQQLAGWDGWLAAGGDQVRRMSDGYGPSGFFVKAPLHRGCDEISGKVDLAKKRAASPMQEWLQQKAEH